MSFIIIYLVLQTILLLLHPLLGIFLVPYIKFFPSLIAILYYGYYLFSRKGRRR